MKAIHPLAAGTLLLDRHAPGGQAGVEGLDDERFREAAVEILRGIDLTVPQGQTLALLGRNGTGKTTFTRGLLRALGDPA